jgi:TRAP-type C4-dicarboxylate transport system permease small subunit
MTSSSDAPSSLLTNLYSRVYESYVFSLITVLLLAMVGLTITDVALRLTRGSIGLSEVTIYMMIWTAYLPLGTLQQDNRHIRIDYFTSRLSGRTYRAVERGSLILQLLATLYLLQSAVLMLLESAGNATPRLKIPVSLLYLAMIAGVTLLLITYVLNIREVKTWS